MLYGALFTTVCDAEDGLEHKSWLESKNWTFEQISNYTCLASVDQQCVKALLFSLSYFTVDILFMLFIQDDESDHVEGGGNASSLKQQMIFHHAIVTSGILLVFI